MSISNQTCKTAMKVLFAATAFALTSCQTMAPKKDDYDVPAYRPSNPNNVSIKVSLNKQMIYVMEGQRPLLVTATSVGTPANPTPRGSFRVYNRIEHKRSGSYGFGVPRNGGAIYACKSSQVRSGDRYVGFPMAYWVEFSPAYGFHSGYVWNIPRSHGCLRLHPNVAPKFWALAKMGTPINIAHTQPEDATLGANAARPGPEHYLAPDPPASDLISSSVFQKPTTPIFVD